MANEQEASRPNAVRVIRQRPPVQDSQPIGYNRERYMHHVNALTYWNYGGLNSPYNTVDPQLSHLVHPELWNRSMSNVGAVTGNIFVWDDIPELANLPTSGHPELVNQQYIMVPSLRIVHQKKPSSKRMVGNNIPTAYGVPQQTAKNPNPVMQVPRNQIQSAIAQAQSGSNFFKWLKSQLFGGNQNG